MLNKNYLKFLSGLIIVITISASVFAYVSKTSLPFTLSAPHIIPATGTIEVGFSPHGNITKMIVKELDSAKKSIEVQAYSFTSPEIAKALVDAHRRGVQVRVILDKSQQTEKYSSATFLSNAGVPTHIDKAFSIAHNKIMIVDGIDVITGSFNFTKGAEERNAENCLILRGNPKLVELYEENWQWRWDET